MSIISLDLLLSEAEALRNKAWPVRDLIQYRHKLTANIEFNLYGGGTKEEGRRALAVRNLLDNMIFDATASDVLDGDLGGIEHLKKGIAMENIAEKLQILEEISASAKQPSMNMKRAMISLITDADRLERFTPDHQAIMKAAASGSSFLAARRFRKILTAIQRDAQAVQAA